MLKAREEELDFNWSEAGCFPIDSVVGWLESFENPLSSGVKDSILELCWWCKSDSTGWGGAAIIGAGGVH